jgi:hypothetical protein
LKYLLFAIALSFLVEQCHFSFLNSEKIQYTVSGKKIANKNIISANILSAKILSFAVNYKYDFISNN